MGATKVDLWHAHCARISFAKYVGVQVGAKSFLGHRLLIQTYETRQQTLSKHMCVGVVRPSGRCGVAQCLSHGHDRKGVERADQ